MLRRIVEGVELIHVGELNDDDAVRFPMAALRQFVGCSFRQPPCLAIIGWP